MLQDILKTGEWVGIVEDNLDPDKKQRVRIRVPYLHGDAKDIPKEHLPWCQPKRDNNGIAFQIPEIGKVINVTFPNGNLYYPIYDNAQHLNINLQKKIESLDGDDYIKFLAIAYNHNYQIFIDTQEGINMIYKFTKIKINEDGINLDLHKNKQLLNLGDENADQEAVLGTHFFEWFDTLMQTLLNAYIGNNGAACIANPDLINVFSQYQAKKASFKSKHVYVVDNNKVKDNKFDVDSQTDDTITFTNKVLPKKNAPSINDAAQQEHEEYIAKQNQVETPVIISATNPVSDDEIISFNAFKQLCSKSISNDKVTKLHAGLNKALNYFNMRNPIEISLFLGQCMEETGKFRVFTEMGDNNYFQKYESMNRKYIDTARNNNYNVYKDLHYSAGDGSRYKGRGAIQLTFKLTYFDFTKYCQDTLKLDVDFVAQPDLVATEDYVFLSACWYWCVNKDKKKFIKSAVADDNILAITYLVNGTGMLHLPERIKNTNLAREVIKNDLKKFNQDTVNNKIVEVPNSQRKLGKIKALHQDLINTNNLYA